LDTDRGESYFLKWNQHSPPEMFAAEADGLRALAEPGYMKVPEVLGYGEAGPQVDASWLLMEFIPRGSPGSDYGTRMGEGLAKLHRSPRASSAATEDLLFGWSRDNFIGSLPQQNRPSASWATFWGESRLEPQLRMARNHGHFRGSRSQVLDTLLDRLPALLSGSEEGGPALLHGDLWSGNYYPGPAGEPVLIDPAAYRGVGEVDLAMMELFGHLPRGFREGYGGEAGIPPEYDAFRRDLYQLYYLLVHVNLFGAGYVSGSLAAAERALRGC
jgi:fructosamine-3-kinase